MFWKETFSRIGDETMCRTMYGKSYYILIFALDKSMSRRNPMKILHRMCLDFHVQLFDMCKRI